MLLMVLPIVLSAGSLIVAITALVLTYRRSGQALEHSRKAAASALWSGVQTAVQRFIGFDPTAEPIGDRLANFHRREPCRRRSRPARDSRTCAA